MAELLTEEEPEPFRFTVTRTAQDPDRWSVYLPHQCDSWVIAGDDYYSGVRHEVAVADLERFIAEAQDALAALRSQRPLTPPAPTPPAPRVPTAEEQAEVERHRALTSTEQEIERLRREIQRREDHP